jgi:hypothetical protein
VSGRGVEKVGELLGRPFVSRSWSVPLPLLLKVEGEAARLQVTRSAVMQAALALYFSLKEEPRLAERLEALVKAVDALARGAEKREGVELRLAEVLALAKRGRGVVGGG